VTISVETFNPSIHLDALVEVLQHVRAGDPTYPPPIDVDDSPAAMRQWLVAEDASARWVAVVDGSVAGHVMILPPHAYLTDFLDSIDYSPRAARGFTEVARVFVDPSFWRRGIASMLLETAIGYAWSKQLQPALAVVTTSTAAIELYGRAGLIRLGSFCGVHGENVVMIDESAPD